MWLLKQRHNWPDTMLGVFFGLSHTTVSNYCDEIGAKFNDEFVPRIFYLPSKAEVEPYISREFKAAFPNVFLMGDGTHGMVDTPTLKSLNGLTFCVYKWGTTFQIVLCKMDLIAFCLMNVSYNCLTKILSFHRDINTRRKSGWEVTNLWREGR
jgi:hypothetical protein